MRTVKQGDTHTIYFGVRDERGQPVNLTGATYGVYIQMLGKPVISLPVNVYGDPTLGVLSHKLSGTLDPGTYSLVIKFKVGDEQKTSPTDGLDCLEVTATIGAPL